MSRIAQELLSAYEAAKARGVRDVDITGASKSRVTLFSRLLRELRSDNPPGITDKTIEWVCEGLGEVPLLVPEEIAEEVRRIADVVRKGRPKR